MHVGAPRQPRAPSTSILPLVDFAIIGGAMRSLHAVSLALVALSAAAFALALSSLTTNDDLAALFWGTAGALVLATSSRLTTPKGVA